jgi:hypothetical protein
VPYSSTKARLACALWACLTPVTFVAPKVAAEERVLHEFLPSVDPDEVQGLTRAARRDASENADSPVPAPVSAPISASGAGATPSRAETATETETAADESPDPQRGRERSAAPNSESFRPDRQTSLEGSLDYFEAFNPSIAPFKRVTAFGAVALDDDGKTPVLSVGDTRHQRVPLETADTAPPDRRARDRFVGEIDVDFRANVLQPMPSVSPESRVLSLTTRPAMQVQVERDGADNFFLRALGPIPDSPVHVRWDTDAPRAYFGTDIPATKLRELPKPTTKLERSIARRGLRFAAQLGISPNSDLRSALEKLTGHFRNFVESAEPPANTGDLYEDLVQGGKGLCRHRAYGFVVTARALNIEARFVQNEAHSWVEVRVPETGFVRIDLGGATHGLTAHDTGGRSSYVPAQPDTLPRPVAYRQSRARAAQGAEEAAISGKAASPKPDLSTLSGRWLLNETNGTPNNQSQAPAAASGNGSQPGTDKSPPAKRALHLSIDDRRIQAVRGGKLVLTGRAVEDGERGVPGLRVEVWILRQERQQRMLLAVQVSDADGYFRADFGVPPDLAVGDYRLIVRSDGDAQHLPAISD